MKRQYQPLIQEYLSYFPCVALIGARQTGKSTLIQMVANNRESFDLEARVDYDQIARDPDFFLRSKQAPIAIDEAQLIPELFPALRVAIDRNRSVAGQYLLSGPSSPELLSAIAESLAGRIGIIEIAPFSFSETREVDTPNLLSLFQENFSAQDIFSFSLPAAEHAPQLQHVNDYWFYGGYPEPWLKEEGRFREVWREQYLKTYIERDVAKLFPNLNSVRFRRFIELLAGCSGSIINYSNIANLLDVSQPTVKDYFKIAHGTFMWRNLPPYTKNVTKRIVKHPRGYFRDTGLLHHILQIASHQRLQSHPQMGASWEGFVIEEILRSLNAAGINYIHYYYRTSGGAEIDLVVEGKFGLIPFEIKHTQSVALKQLKAIKDFIVEFNCPFGIVVNNDEKVRQYDENLYGIPLSLLTASTSNAKKQK